MASKALANHNLAALVLEFTNLISVVLVSVSISLSTVALVSAYISHSSVELASEFTSHSLAALVLVCTSHNLEALVSAFTSHSSVVLVFINLNTESLVLVASVSVVSAALANQNSEELVSASTHPSLAALVESVFKHHNLVLPDLVAHSEVLKVQLAFKALKVLVVSVPEASRALVVG